MCEDYLCFNNFFLEFFAQTFSCSSWCMPQGGGGAPLTLTHYQVTSGDFDASANTFRHKCVAGAPQPPLGWAESSPQSCLSRLPVAPTPLSGSLHSPRANR